MLRAELKYFELNIECFSLNSLGTLKCGQQLGRNICNTVRLSGAALPLLLRSRLQPAPQKLGRSITAINTYCTGVYRLDAEAISRECNMRLYRTSVKEDLNVSVVFQHLAENYVNKVSTSSVTSSRHGSCNVLLGHQD